MAVLKKEFIDRMAEIGGITKKEARKGFDLFIETLIDYMAEDKKVMFTGFGRFEMKNYEERISKSPLGEGNCIIPEHKKMRFYASEILADRLKKSKRQG